MTAFKNSAVIFRHMDIAECGTSGASQCEVAITWTCFRLTV
jgi:hypothetical protein